jgi:hypothetical protein
MRVAIRVLSEEVKEDELLSAISVVMIGKPCDGITEPMDLVYLENRKGPSTEP